MSWTYYEHGYMYRINGICMQMYRWNHRDNQYELKNMLSLSEATKRYPDIIEKYYNAMCIKNHTSNSDIYDQYCLDFNRLHIIEDSSIC